MYGKEDHYSLTGSRNCLIRRLGVYHGTWERISWQTPQDFQFLWWVKIWKSRLIRLKSSQSWPIYGLVGVATYLRLLIWKRDRCHDFWAGRKSKNFKDNSWFGRISKSLINWVVEGDKIFNSNLSTSWRWKFYRFSIIELVRNSKISRMIG